MDKWERVMGADDWEAPAADLEARQEATPRTMLAVACLLTVRPRSWPYLTQARSADGGPCPYSDLQGRLTASGPSAAGRAGHLHCRRMLYLGSVYTA